MRKLVSRAVVCILALVLAITVVPMSTEAKSANRVVLDSKSKMTLYSGDYKQLKIRGIYQKGKNLYPNKSQKTLWKKVMTSSSNKSIATISKDGKVTAKRAGTVRLSVTSRKNRKVKATVKLTVKNAKKGKVVLSCKGAESWEQNGYGSYYMDAVVGSSATLKVKSVYGTNSKKVTFSSSNPSVVSVDKKGKITVKAYSSSGATIYATYSDPGVYSCTWINVSTIWDCKSRGHYWDEWDDQAPSCTEDGYRCRYCKVCGEADEVDLPALGHDWTVKEHVDVAKGVTGGDKCVCSRCGEEDFRNKVYYQPTEEELEASLATVKATYPTGTEWGGSVETTMFNGVPFFMHFEDDDENSFMNDANQYIAGCGGFACLVSDAVYGSNVVYRTHHDASKVRIGDIVYFEGDSINHKVIVIGFTDDGGWITAEGNVGGRVKWNGFARKMVGSDLYTVSSGAGEIPDGASIKQYYLQSHNTKVSVYTRWK